MTAADGELITVRKRAALGGVRVPQSEIDAADLEKYHGKSMKRDDQGALGIKLLAGPTIEVEEYLILAGFIAYTFVTWRRWVQVERILRGGVSATKLNAAGPEAREHFEQYTDPTMDVVRSNVQYLRTSAFGSPERYKKKAIEMKFKKNRQIPAWEELQEHLPDAAAKYSATMKLGITRRSTTVASRICVTLWMPLKFSRMIKPRTSSRRRT